MFDVSGDAYDAFMGRYSKPLASAFADFAGVADGWSGLDVGCGSGALTQELIERLGVDSVAACDPSNSFVAHCAERFPGLDVRHGSAEQMPFEDSSVDLALAQLVLHFSPDPLAAVHEIARVVRPGGTVAACVWEFDSGMEMLRHFWDAALSVDPDAPDEARVMQFGRSGEITAVLSEAGLDGVEETTLDVSSDYRDFDELWGGFIAGIGPAGTYCVSLEQAQQAMLRDALFERCGTPTGPFTLRAKAIAARARV